MTKTLVTGASGHLGANLVRDLLDRGHEVVPFVRRSSSLQGLEGLDLEPAVGDLLDRDSLLAAADGCAWVMHAGAVYRNWAPDPDEIRRPALDGTANVLRAAADAGCQRVVVTSSNAAVGYAEDPRRPLDERRWNDGAANVYIRSKTEAERRAFQLGRELDLEVVSALPVGILGPHDHKPTPTTRLIADIVNRTGSVFMAVSLTDVRDVARAHTLLAERGRPGERYLVAGDNVQEEELAALFRELAGVDAKRGLPPTPLLKLVAAISEKTARFTGKEPIITRDVIRDAGGRHLVYDSSKIREELDFHPRSAREVLTDTLRWLLFRGWIDEPLASTLRDRYPPDDAWGKA